VTLKAARKSLFKAGGDQMFETTRLHDPRAHKQPLFSELGITHSLLVFFKIANLLLDALAKRTQV
jgi:hypothetical protein